jgi:HEAT repeat protein
MISPKHLIHGALAIVLSLGASPTYAQGGQTGGTGVRQPQPGQPTGNPGGARTGARPPVRVPAPASVDSARWEVWWENNREDFLVPRGVTPGETTGDAYSAAPRGLTAHEIRTQVMPVLLKALKSTDQQVRSSATIAIGRAGGGGETDILVAALSDSERTVLEGAVVGLGLLLDPRAEQALAKVLADPSRTARERGLAALALGLSGGDDARKPLFENLGAELDSSGGSRVKAGNLEAVRALGAALWAGADRKDGNTERSAITASLIQRALVNAPVKDRHFLGIGSAALAKPRDAGSLQFILASLADSRSDLRAGAAIAAGRIIRPEDKKSVQTLINALAAEGDVFPKRMMLISLGRIGGPDARKQLVTELDAQDRQHRAFAALALGISGATEVSPKLRKELEAANDESLRGALAIALGLMHDPEAFKLVADMTKKNGSPELLSHLMWFFALNQSRAGVPIVEAVLTNTKVPELQAAAALALGLLGAPESQPVLSKLLTEAGTITVKGAAATGLGRMGDRRALEALVKVIENPSEQDLSRAFAVVGLGILSQKNPWPPFSRVTIDSNYDIRHEAIDEMRDLL